MSCLQSIVESSSSLLSDTASCSKFQVALKKERHRCHFHPLCSKFFKSCATVEEILHQLVDSLHLVYPHHLPEMYTSHVVIFDQWLSEPPRIHGSLGPSIFPIQVAISFHGAFRLSNLLLEMSRLDIEGSLKFLQKNASLLKGWVTRRPWGLVSNAPFCVFPLVVWTQGFWCSKQTIL